MTPTKGHSTAPRRTKVRARQEQEESPARIRIPNFMVSTILAMQPEVPTMDVVQAQLLRLDQSATSQEDRILVTRDPGTLDLLRDWCTRLIADNRLSDDSNQKQLVASASRVIGFMDNHQSKAEKLAAHAAAPKTRTTHRRAKAEFSEPLAS